MRGSMRTGLTLAAGFCVASLMATSLTGCRITKSGPDWIIEPSDDGKPRKIPPTRVRQITIGGQCYWEFEGRGGTTYCLPCDAEGTTWAQPCDSINSPTRFLAYLDELLLQEGVVAESQEILEHFGLDTWTLGDAAPLPMGFSLIDTDLEEAEVVVISRSDWDWPDDTHATVEMVVFPDATGLIPDLTDTTPDAIAFRVSGTFENVANSVASMFDTGFTWTYQPNNQNIYVVETFALGGGIYDVEVSHNNTVVWDNY